MSERFVPNLKQVEQAAQQLPDAEIWPEDEFLVPLDSHTDRQLTFRRIRFNSRSQGKTYRWVYDGKVLVK